MKRCLEMTLLPEDVHGIILQYLEFNDIFSAFQQTCKAWWSTVAMLTTVDLQVSEPGRRPFAITDNFIGVLTTRIPNIVKIHLPTWIETQDEERMLCLFPKAHIVFKKHRPILLCEDDLQDYPHYRGFKIVRFDEPETIVMSALHITHLEIATRTPTPFVEKYLPDIAKTVTHVNLRDLNNIGIVERFIQLLPINSTTTHLKCDRPLNDELWEMLCMKCPRLLEYEGYSNNIVALSKYAPKITRLVVRNPRAKDGQNLFKNLKVLHTDADCEGFELDEGVQLYELQSSDLQTFQNLLPHLKQVKRLHVNIRQTEISSVIENCTVVQEIFVDKAVNIAGIRRLVEGCPKLRFIYGANWNIRHGRVGDVIVVREFKDFQPVTRPAKKSKNYL